jgi:hypothetical protein
MSKKQERRLWLEAMYGFATGLFLFVAWLFYSDMAMGKYGFVVFPADEPTSKITGIELVLFTAHKFLIRTGWLQQGILSALSGAGAFICLGYLYRLWKFPRNKS